MLRAWQNESTLKHDRVGNVAATMCPRFAGPLPSSLRFDCISRIAGLSVKKAEAIVEWRKRNGRFVNREQLKQVKGIGPKTYQQCAGFLRISNESPREDHAHSEGETILDG